ncbi:MAG: thioredoxin domain-containing protein [Patescibacteria group bacterium]|jgi:protein-disulfide isomerase
MKYFWQFFAVIIGLSAVIFLFFVLSVKTKDSITFTGQRIVTTPEITSADPSRGPANAPVTLVMYEDFQCSACAELEPVLNTLLANYGTALRLVWKDLPNNGAHPEAIPAAVAARCAGKQNKFWEFHDTLMANQPLLGDDLYTRIAGELKLKANAFSQCVKNQDTLPLVERGYDEGLALQIASTPTIFLNGTRYSGSLSLSELTRAIDALLPTM